jgi:hypothetical protein
MQKVACVAVALVLAAAEAWSDVWDISTQYNDDSLLWTPNLLIHGSDQVHDLGVRPGPVADLDWYEVDSAPYASYEFLQDGSTGDTLPLVVERFDGQVNLLQTGRHLGGVNGPADAQSMGWENTTASLHFDYVRVTSPGCGTSCTSEDQYRVRFYETTYAIPRFNNFGGQTSVLIVQNLNPDPIVAHAYFWDPAGSLLATHTFTLNARSILVINTASIPGLAGASGAITLTHTGRYGSLSGKAVALEPSTGFSFDSPMMPKP